MTAPLRPVTPVGILTASLDRLAEEAHRAGGLDADWLARLDDARRLASGLESYAAACTTPESPALRRLDARTRSAEHLEREMLSGHIEGQLLKMLVRATGARRVLEIGLFTGYSALAMAEALPEDGRLVACEIDSEIAALAQRNLDDSPGGHKVVVLVGPAQQSLVDLAAAGECFDMVFLDADKGGYAGYLDLLLESSLLAEGALVCVDNTLLQGEPWLSGESSPNGTAIADFNRAVALDPRIEQVLVPVRDGLTLIRRA